MEWGLLSGGGAFSFNRNVIFVSTFIKGVTVYSYLPLNSLSAVRHQIPEIVVNYSNNFDWFADS